MDNCVTDGWETFKGWTPYLVAIIIFIFWHLQKGKEVTASECKAYWERLDDLERIYKNLEEYADFKSDNYKEFDRERKKWKDINLSITNLIRELTNNDNKVVESTEKLIQRFKSDNTLDKLQRFGSDESRHERVGCNYVLNTIAEIKYSLFPYIKYRFFIKAYRRTAPHT